MSLTVKFFVQVAKFPAPSVTVIVTVCVPRPTSVPAVGDCVITSDPVAVQLSEATTEPVRSGTEAWHEPSAEAEAPEPQSEITGCVTSGEQGSR